MKSAVMIAVVAVAAAGSYQAFKFTRLDHDRAMTSLAQKCVGSEELKSYSADAVNLLMLDLKEVVHSTEKYPNKDEYKAHMKLWREEIFDKRHEALSDNGKRDLQRLMVDIVSHDDKLKCLSYDLTKERMSSSNL